jgi:predicted AlkP superfamily phosphohydrolase/phosphomutase
MEKIKLTDEYKLLVIGLDGATFDVLSPLMQQGSMPNLAALMKKGCWGRLSSTIPPFTAAAWSSFITGKNPGQHGVISFRHTRDRFNYDVHGSGFTDARRFDETLWEILSAGGKQLGIVNVPLTYPARSINGYMVTGMLTPPNAGQFTYPPEFASTLGQDYVIDVDFIRDEEGFRIRGFPPKAEMIAQIRNMSRVRAQACARLLQSEPWDFFMVVFTSTDRVQHFFWDDWVAVAKSGFGTKENIRREVEGYLQELDDGIGQLVDLAGPSATVLVISDHGFGPAQTSRLYVNVWLERLGLLHRRGSEGIFDLEYWRVMVGRNKRLKALLRRLLPQSAQDKATTATRSTSADILDWSKTKAYYVPIYFHVCGVEVNLAGARREGIVQPGIEYEVLRDQIIQKAKRLTDPRNGKSIVETAARREELYHGTYVEEFPDVILVLDPDYIGASSLAGSSLTEPHSPTRPGEHRQDGIFIVAGPAVHPQGELDDLCLIDIPPTILYTMRQPVPTSFDGRVLQEVFAPAYLIANPIQMQDLPLPSKVTDHREMPGYSETEETQIEGRLRGLGYIE